MSRQDEVWPAALSSNWPCIYYCAHLPNLALFWCLYGLLHCCTIPARDLAPNALTHSPKSRALLLKNVADVWDNTGNRKYSYIIHLQIWPSLLWVKLLYSSEKGTNILLASVQQALCLAQWIMRQKKPQIWIFEWLLLPRGCPQRWAYNFVRQL